MNNRDEIKELFSKSFENFEKEVDPGLWDKIQTDLNSISSAGSSSAVGKVGLIKSIIIGTFSVASITAGVLIFSNLNDENAKADTKVEETNLKVTEESTNDEADLQKDLVVIENEEQAIKRIENSKDPLIVKEKEELKKTVLTDIQHEDPIDYSDVSLNDLLDQNLLDELSKKEQTKKDEANVNNNPIVKNNNLRKEDDKIVKNEEPILNDIKEEKNPKSAAEVYLEKIINVLTPNNDGINDQKTLESKEIARFEVLLFNQKGKLVFEKAGKTVTIDGKDMFGNMLKSGTYRMVVIANDLYSKKHTKQTYLSIIR